MKSIKKSLIKECRDYEDGEMEGEIEGERLALGDTELEIDGLRDGLMLAEILGEREALGETELEILGESEGEIDGLNEGEMLGEIEGDTTVRVVASKAVAIRSKRFITSSFHDMNKVY